MTASISYEADDLRILAALEERHFWFRSRRRIIVDALRRWFPDMQSYLEIGCGTGYILRGIRAAFPESILIASDALSEGKVYGAKSIGCYRQVGGTAPVPNSHPLAAKLDPFSKMKLVDIDFTTGDINKTVYYIFYWIDKDGNKGPESAVFDYTVI